MVASHRVTPIRTRRRAGRRPARRTVHGRLAPSGVAWLVVAIAASAVGCAVREDEAVDALCGDVSSRLPSSGVGLARADDRAPLFEPSRERRYTLRGRPRDAVTGFREIRLFERATTVDVDATRHVESVPADLRLAFEPELVFAPRVRVANGDAWTELGWVRVSKTRRDERSVYDVPFDFSALTLPSPHADTLEIGLSAYVSSSRTAHAWETRPLELTSNSVLAASLGVAPGAADEGRMTWRVLACEGESCGCVHAEVIDAKEVARTGWQERRIALGDFAGPSVSLRLETEVQSGDSGAVDGALWAEPALLERLSDGAATRPNLLLISLDTLGADHLGVYGYARDTSPFIDDVLAPRGTVFLNALAPATTTGPSHMTLFTSLPPSVHGAVSNLGGRPLPEAVPTLAETLRTAGYVTAAVTENGAITQALGFGRGFDHYEENQSARMVRPEGHIEATFAAGRELAERARGLPWFVFVQTYQVHYPYSPPPEYRALFADDGLDAPGADAIFTGGRADYHPVLYDREIRYTDDQLRAFLTGLEESGLLENTIVVVLADHGEAFFEHSYLGHGADLHRETVRVPLIMVGPGVPAGSRVEGRVGLGDVMPTLLELLDVPVPAGNLGRSLVPLLASQDAVESKPSRPIFSEAWQVTGVTRRGGVKLDQPTLAIERDDYKLIRYRGDTGPRHALFDLSADPQERMDLMPVGGSPTGTAARHFEALSALLDEYEAETARLAAELGVKPDVAPDTEIDPARLEKLRALGYVE